MPLPPPPPPDSMGSGRIDSRENPDNMEPGGPGGPGIGSNDDMKCNTIQTSVEIFYTGKGDEPARKPEQDEMLALLTEIIHAQAAAGDFEPVGRLGIVESRSGVLTSETNQDRGGINTSSTRFKASVAVGAILLFLLILLLAIYCCCCRKRKVIAGESEKEKPGETDDSSNEGGGKSKIGNIWPLSGSQNNNKSIDPDDTPQNTGIWPFTRSQDNTKSSDDEGSKPKTAILPFTRSRSNKSIDEGEKKAKTGLWPLSRSQSNKSAADEGSNKPTKTGIWPLNRSNTPVVNATKVDSFDDGNQSPGGFCNACKIQ